jgi:hypothetical protein
VVWRGEDWEGMASVLEVEMGMDMALVRGIELKDDCHVQCQTRTHALHFKSHR